jgi:hypothetical protein
MPPGEKPGDADQLTMVRQIRSFCGATAFDGGRMRDTMFVGMPKVPDLANLTRASLPIATKDTFFYAASVLDLRKEMEPGPRTPGLGWLSGLNTVTDTLSLKGITLEQWKAAFGSELGIVGSWAPNSQWPSLVIALPVKDSPGANKIVTAVTSTDPAGAEWNHWEKEGVRYFSNSSPGQLFSFSPTLGLSDRMLVVGADPGSVEASIKRSATGSSELAASRNFQNAEGAVPTAQQAFVYVDPALIYSRFDTTLRPLLAMGAAFLPAVSDTVDLSKLPPAEVVARHLGPMVMSQSYRGDGYVAESVGPVPFYQSMIAAVGVGTAAKAFYQQWMPGSGSTLPPSIKSPGSMQPSPSPTPEDSP